MTKWTKKSIEKAYENGQRDFTYENFSELDLDGICLIDANLMGTILTGADMRGADLTGADMTGADLTGATLDYSCWPLWCGSYGVKVDKKIAGQLCYHFCAVDCDDPEYQKARAKVLDFANQMHRSDVKRLK